MKYTCKHFLLKKHQLKSHQAKDMFPDTWDLISKTQDVGDSIVQIILLLQQRNVIKRKKI